MRKINAGFDNKGWFIVAVLFVIIFLGIVFRGYVSQDENVSRVFLSPSDENEKIILTIIVGVVFLIMVIGLVWVTKKRS